MVNFLAKQSISKLMETSPKQVKEGLMSQCANVLACYRKNCASPSSAGQLILPECMKLLPLYSNCVIKSDAITGGSDLGCDDRAYHMSCLRSVSNHLLRVNIMTPCCSSMDVSSSLVYFYPRVFALHTLNPEEDGIPEQMR